jgi:hypothetical protein
MTTASKNKLTKIASGRFLIGAVVVWVFYAFEAFAWKFVVGYAALYAFLTAGARFYAFMEWPGPYSSAMYPNVVLDWLWNGFSWRQAECRETKADENGS